MLKFSIVASIVASTIACAGQSVTHDGGCLTVGTDHVFEGTVEKKTVFGPPNYGENPETDKKITLNILSLRHAGKLCVGDQFVSKVKLVGYSGKEGKVKIRGAIYNQEQAIDFLPFVIVVSRK